MAENGIICPCEQFKEAIQIAVEYHKLFKNNIQRQKELEDIIKKLTELQANAGLEEINK